MVDVPPLDCSKLDAEQILRETKETILAMDPKEKIIRIRLENIPSHIQRGIDFHQAQSLCKTAVHFEIKSTTLKSAETLLAEGYRMKSLTDEFQKYLSTQTFPEKDLLLKLGLHYIQKNEERDDTA
jgi:hypothetical protein